MSKNKNKQFIVDFMGIGAPRCATTWLSQCLEEHPQICFSKVKETHFFDKEYNFKKGLGFYQKFFLHCHSSQKKGEFTPSYYLNPQIAKNIKKFFPEIKIIVSLRNPVSRAFSHYLYDYRRGMTSKPFQYFWERKKLRYIDDGFYYKHLKKFLSCFRKENILVLIYEDIKKDSRKELEKVYEFLGVDSSFVPSFFDRAVNQSVAVNYRFLFINKIINYRKRLKNSRGGRLLVFVFKKIGFNFFVKLILRFNKVDKSKKERVSKEILYKKFSDELRKLYFEDIKKLEDLLGKDLSSWYAN